MSPLASAMLGDQERMPPLASMVMANAGPAPSIDAASAPAPADAWSQNASAVQDWLAQQQAQSARMGLWNDQTGLPTQAGVMDAARQYANGMQPATIKAFHGSPYDFSAFDMSKIGTGEGAQAYGHGLYFAGNEGVAQGYKSRLAPLGTLAQGADGPQGIAARILGSGATPEQAIAELEGRAAALHLNDLPATDADAFRQKMRDAAEFIRNPNSPGRMYEVNLNVEPGQLLDWDKPLSQQSPQVQQKLRAISAAPDPTLESAAGHFGYSPEEFNALPADRQQALMQQTPASAAAYRTDPTGGELYESSKLVPGDYRVPPAASAALRAAGIPGIQYLDAGSRAAGDGTRNYVMFDPNLIDIVRKYGLAGAMLGAPAAAPFMPSQAPQQAPVGP